METSCLHPPPTSLFHKRKGKRHQRPRITAWWFSLCQSGCSLHHNVSKLILYYIIYHIIVRMWWLIESVVIMVIINKNRELLDHSHALKI